MVEVLRLRTGVVVVVLLLLLTTGQVARRTGHLAGTVVTAATQSLLGLGVRREKRNTAG